MSEESFDDPETHSQILCADAMRTNLFRTMFIAKVGRNLPSKKELKETIPQKSWPAENEVKPCKKGYSASEGYPRRPDIGIAKDFLMKSDFKGRNFIRLISCCSRTSCSSSIVLFFENLSSESDQLSRKTDRSASIEQRTKIRQFSPCKIISNLAEFLVPPFLFFSLFFWLSSLLLYANMRQCLLCQIRTR